MNDTREIGLCISPFTFPHNLLALIIEKVNQNKRQLLT